MQASVNNLDTCTGPHWELIALAHILVPGIAAFNDRLGRGGSTLYLGSANYCYQGKILHKCTNRLFFENHKLAVFDITLYLESAS